MSRVDIDAVAESTAVATPDREHSGFTLPIVESCGGNGPALIARLLAEQQELTAVEQFSREYEDGDVSAPSKRYSRLLPAAPPAPGEQYAFEVDLDRCSGCKACVAACHSLNGLDEQEIWRDVGLLVGGTSANPVMQHVTAACHHCLQPACMTACPVDAYEKDPVTGIVLHLDDQCFGCQYCILACPYEVPRYNAQKGIVRKCDMCSQRLAAGEAPACVQSCPHEAIAIRTVDMRQVVEDSEAHQFLPAAPEPHLTLPTTSYKTRRVFPRNMLPADYHSVSPQHPHWPLIVMLVLTQLSVGAVWVGLVLESLLDVSLVVSFRPVQATSALLFGMLAIGASVAHLGRPLYAFRAVIGLKHSWLSREILAFGGFAALACLYAASSWPVGGLAEWSGILGWSVAAAGLAGLICSIMIYVVTRRDCWRFGVTALKFLLTAAVMGIAATWLTILILALFAESNASRELTGRAGGLLAAGLLAAMGAKLVIEAAVFAHLADNRNSPLKRSARLMVGELSNYVLARFACGILGGIAMPLFLNVQSAEFAASGRDLVLLVVVSMLFLACLAGELLERFLFFAAAVAPRMPGGVRP